MQESTKTVERAAAKTEDAAPVARAAKIISNLPEAERDRVLYWLEGAVFMAKTYAQTAEEQKNAV